MTDHLEIEIQKFIMNYIHDHAARRDLVLNKATNFVESQLLDSFAILNLIMTLESQYRVRFKPQELADSRLQTIHALAQIIHEKIIA